jgi:hypothetical protein
MGICSGCSVVKPVAGLLTGPIHADEELGAGPGAASVEGVIGMLVVESVAGVVSGFATGIISDARVLLGETSEPTRHWANPFRTNAD